MAVYVSTGWLPILGAAILLGGIGIAEILRKSFEDVQEAIAEDRERKKRIFKP